MSKDHLKINLTFSPISLSLNFGVGGERVHLIKCVNNVN